MKLVLVLATLFALQAPAPQPTTPAPPPGTDIYLLPVRGGLASLRAAKPQPVSTAPGYDNQPSFSPDGNRILFATSEVVIGWLLLKQGIVAAKKRETATEKDRDFYQGKLAAIRFYARNVLPGVTLTRKLFEQGTLELLEVPEAAF